jgi:hypothetical protein
MKSPASTNQFMDQICLYFNVQTYLRWARQQVN